jgi:hypothetical protein
MANATVLHQLKASAQYRGAGVQRVVDRLARALMAQDELADGLTFVTSNAYTNSPTAVKASAGRIYAVIIEGNTGNNGNGVLQLFDMGAASVNLGVVTSSSGKQSRAIDTLGFVAGMTRCFTFDPADGSGTTLYTSAISVAVTTSAFGTLAVSSLPTVTIVYA